MLHILYGEDSFSINQAVEQIKSNLGDMEMLAINTSRLSGDRLSLAELKNNCSAAPFLSSHRLVIVEGLLERFDPAKKETRADKDSRKGTPRSRSALGDWKAFSSYVSQMPTSTELVLVDSAIKSNNTLLHDLLPLANMKRFPLLKGDSLKGWIRQSVKDAGGKISPRAVSLLADLVGGDLWIMQSEIEKLLLYRQERAINEEDVGQLVSYAREASIFALVDAIVEGRLETAQKVLHQLYLAGDSSTHILFMITRQYRLIALAKDLPPGLSSAQVQRNLGLSPGYAMDKAISQARRYSLQGVKDAYDKLLETDLSIKTGKYGGDDQLALEFLVTELCSPAI